MNIVGVQTDIIWHDKQKNFDQVQAMLQTSEIAPDSLIVLPEMFATGFSMNVAKIAEQNEGPTQTFLSELAREHNSHIVAGIVTQTENGLGRNQALVLDPTGTEIARYSKLHPFSYSNETDHYQPGNKIITFKWTTFTVAPFICYDLRFPEPFRIATQRGANLMLVIANWPSARADHWSTLLKARAIENQSYIAGINRCGKDPKKKYPGASAIIDPQGNVLAEAADQPSLIQADLDMDALKDYRATFPALRDMRSDYSGL